MRQLLVTLALVSFATHVAAADLSSLSSSEATSGLKEALMQGASKAVGKLGTVDGFLKNPKVKIPLPDSMKKARTRWGRPAAC